MTMSQPLPSLFETAKPRPASERNDAYAANLSSAIRRELQEQDGARRFLAGTHVTEAMKRVCRQVMERLYMGHNSPHEGVYVLESGFGGGKTHTVIGLACMALYPDLVREMPPGPKSQSLSEPAHAVDDVVLVAINGQDASDQGYIRCADGTQKPSLADAIIDKLGGHHLGPGNPGAAAFAELMEDRPVLIMIDELPHLIAKLEERPKARSLVATTLSDLAAAVRESWRGVLIITAPEAGGSDALQGATDEVHRIIDDIRKLGARVGESVIPSSPQDLPHILRQRLFQDWDEDVRTDTARAYAKLFPAEDHKEQAFLECYPYHPDLLNILQTRLGDNPSFQKVRGTLRLLSSVIAYWQGEGVHMKDAILHPHHVDPSIPAVRNQFLGRLERGELQVAIDADIENARPRHQHTEGAHEAVVTIMLGSVAPSAKRGLHRHEVIDCILSPRQADRGLLDSAIRNVEITALYITNDLTRGLWFSNEPSLSKMALDLTRGLRDRDNGDWLRTQVMDLVEETYGSPRHAPLMDVHLWTSMGNNLPDNPNKVQLAVLNPDYLYAEKPDLEAELTKLHTQGPGQDVRRHRNNVLYLVANETGLGPIENAVVEEMAYQNIHTDDTLRPQLREEAKERQATARKKAFQAILRKWQHLYHPTGRGLHCTRVGNREKVGFGGDILRDLLVAGGWAVDPEHPRILPDTWRKLGCLRRGMDKDAPAATLGELHESFTCTPSKSMFFAVASFMDALCAGVADGTLVAVNECGQRFDAKNPPTPQALNNNCRFYLTEHAPVPDVCPKCKKSLEAKDATCKHCQPRTCPKCGKPTTNSQCPNCVAPTPSRFQQSGAGTVVVRLLHEFMQKHNRPISDIIEMRVDCTTQDLFNDLASRFQDQGSFCRLDWTCESTDKALQLRFRNQTVAWWQKHRRDMLRFHALSGKPAVTQAITTIQDMPDDKFEGLLDAIKGLQEVQVHVVFPS